MEREKGGRKGGWKWKENMLNAKTLHVFGQTKVLFLGKEISGELGMRHGWTARRDIGSRWHGRTSSFLAVIASEGVCGGKGGQEVFFSAIPASVVSLWVVSGAGLGCRERWQGVGVGAFGGRR